MKHGLLFDFTKFLFGIILNRTIMQCPSTQHTQKTANQNINNAEKAAIFQDSKFSVKYPKNKGVPTQMPAVKGKCQGRLDVLNSNNCFHMRKKLQREDLFAKLVI